MLGDDKIISHIFEDFQAKMIELRQRLSKVFKQAYARHDQKQIEQLRNNLLK